MHVATKQELQADGSSKLDAPEPVEIDLESPFSLRYVLGFGAVFLVVLGLQVESMDLGATVRETLPTVGLKLLVAPVVAVAAALVVGIGDPTVTAAFVVLAAGPSAVTPLVLAIEFGDDGAGPGDGSGGVSTADYVGTVVFLTILGSLPVVTGLVLLAELGVLG